MRRWKLRVWQELMKKQARDGRRYSIAEIADAIERSEMQVRRYLRDEEGLNPTMETLRRFADFLGCSIGDLYEEYVEEDRGEAVRPYPGVPSRA